ncbi:hypothetical protein LSH36_108g02002 [Paralvinella palmiformis]|uniref:peptidylprolyl isomerase n=1 Tax=Paralvinella palmiformis TaxID=53620 RepID=A0AAD9JZE6_9ANNE|nr:hypothetical protein LSH36_108g02002 [Paralvinella palmiformis]
MDDHYSVLKTFNREDYDENTVYLKEAINLNQLTVTDSKGGVDFEVDPQNLCEELPEYHKENVHKEVPFDTLGFDDGDSGPSAENGDVESPFEKLRNVMENITEDGGVKKKILKEGIGEKVPLNVEVTVHYSASLEYSDEPFDSTRLRDRPFRYILGCGEMIAGLECGIATMKKGEESQFLVSPEYGFGKRGVPPRIPGDATILFRVELMKWAETTEVQKYFQMPWEDRKVCEFDLLKKVAEQFLQEGKAKYLQQRYIPASKQFTQVSLFYEQSEQFTRVSLFYEQSEHFTQGVRAIEEYCPPNEEVENDFQKLVIRLCQNACVVNMKLNNFSAVKFYADKALVINPKAVKALFYMGKAQRHCGDFDLAVATLRKAQALEPKNMTITSELATINKYKAAIDFSYGDMCRKMFGTKLTKKSGKDSGHKVTSQHLSKLDNQVTNSLKSRLSVFLDSDIMELPLPSLKFTEAECDFIKTFCGDNNLEYVEKGQGSNHHIRLCKKRPDLTIQSP